MKSKVRKLFQEFLGFRAQMDRLKMLSECSTRLLAQQELSRILAAPEFSTESGRLERFSFKAFSQNDEDGILKEIFNRIGTTNRKFAEFGAGNGIENNTAYLLWQDWSGLWIDGSHANCQSQQSSFAWAGERLRSVESMLTVENINKIFENAGMTGEIDFLCIDVDGNDYHLWKALSAVNPRVVAVEYNGFIAPPAAWVMAYNPTYVWDGATPYFGASLESLNRLACKKGYTLVGCNVIGLNSFFVRNDLVEDKFADDTSPEALFHPRRWWLDVIFRTGIVPLDRPFVHE